jgi:glycosyltransferase involved in cell wall biosynthesis
VKILCVIDNLGAGGAQRQMAELASGFKAKGHEVSFLTYYHSPFFNPIIEKNGINITCIQERNYLKRFLKMRHFIRHGKYDAVLSFLEAANFICELSGLPFRKWKLVVGERNADPKISRSIKLRIYRWFHIFADYIVANSFSNIQIVRSVNPLLSKSKCKVIYNIIDFDRWKPIADFQFKKNNKINLVIAASQIYRKNLNGLIEAFALQDRECLNNISVSWYGDRLSEPYFDGSFEEAKQKIISLGLEKLISFYPATNEIAQKVQNADAIGLFSFIEGLPNVVCEGMACAKPIICSNVSDVPGILSFDKNLLCDPADPQSIKRAIIHLINLNADQLAQIGAENEIIAKEKFKKEESINSYLKLFSS